MITYIKKNIFSVYEYFTTHDIRQDSFMNSAFVLLILLFLGQSILLGVYFFSLPEVIVIHSNIYFGIDLIGERIYSIVILLVALIVGLLHSVFVIKLYRHDRELSRLFMGGTIAVMAILFVNVFFIIRLNT